MSSTAGHYSGFPDAYISTFRFVQFLLAGMRIRPLADREDLISFSGVDIPVRVPRTSATIIAHLQVRTYSKEGIVASVHQPDPEFAFHTDLLNCHD